jgi:DNA-binding helix-hairpin-helix protein with protein kinase domain
MTLADESGRPVNIGHPLTNPGGEAMVHEVAGEPEMVAKIYHTPPSLHKLAKLEHLRQIATPKLLRMCAWPANLLFEPKDGRAVRGFLMPLVKGKEVHRLYGPHDRTIEFPDAKWDFLLQVAKNCAAAFETLHEHDVIMADVNEKNLLVSPDGLVRLIDCDSYQIIAEDRYFLCDVGVPLWTPPELQGKDFRGLVRTKNHDRFGLAVLIFQLLFMGRHPYAGIREGRRDFEFEESIADFLFAFSPQTKALGVQPPPHTLPFAAMPNNVARLLEKAFLRGSEKDGARPSGKEWHRALEFMQQNRCVCARDAGHVYPSHLGRCPWCEIYDAGGPNFFSSTTEPPSPVTIETICLLGGNRKSRPAFAQGQRVVRFSATAEPKPSAAGSAKDGPWL